MPPIFPDARHPAAPSLSACGQRRGFSDPRLLFGHETLKRVPHIGALRSLVMTPLPDRTDVVIIGAGHNGLVAAILLARAGLDVVVLEAASVLGGATRTERPFAKAPGLGQSTGSYLLGLMPPELLRTLDVDLPLLRRDPHYFLPTPGRPARPTCCSAATGRPPAAQLERFFSPRDVAADEQLAVEIAALRDDLAPAWLEEPAGVEEIAERHIRPQLQSTFIDLVRGSVGRLSRPVRLQERTADEHVRGDRRPVRAERRAGRPRAPGTTSWCTTCAGCPARTAPG